MNHKGHGKTKVHLLVPKNEVKKVKTALESNTGKNLLDKSRKIHHYNAETRTDQNEELFVVPTEMSLEEPGENGFEDTEFQHFTQWLSQRYPSLQSSLLCVRGITRSESNGNINKHDKVAKKNALINAVQQWLNSLPTDLLSTLQLAIDELVATSPTTYSIYNPMLLLHGSAFHTQKWQLLLSKISRSEQEDLYQNIARHLSITHIATNAPIPLQTQSSCANFLRSPVNLTPLYGDFGSMIDTSPSLRDFDAAFWVSARQNGITQTWAPLYTMFSRGNITEKARLLSLQSVKDAVAEGSKSQQGCTAVDLYAGIGYFAFSYLQAEVGKVLCWELNPWSVEGLRRGAKVNKWPCKVLEENESSHINGVDVDSQLLVFQESNELAMTRIEAMRKHLAPIRHVNCGLLPSSRGSWKTAVSAIDPDQGGWIHLHENIATDNIVASSNGICDEIREICEQTRSTTETSLTNTLQVQGKRVILEHVEHVKTYAPGVMHCVLDIYIPPT